jgi:hypothetical protein
MCELNHIQYLRIMHKSVVGAGLASIYKTRQFIVAKPASPSEIYLHLPT